jgi:biofilm PGA synthesis N-glycosyltransferase PgaC
MDLVSILETIERSPVYFLALVFFAWYPIFSSLMWIFTACVYHARRERRDDEEFYRLDEYPMVTVLIPAFNEERHMRETLEAATNLDYPNYEVVVVDDASKDETAWIVMEFVQAGKVRLIRKFVNQGKAMALNDAIPCTNGSILLIIDADASLDPKALLRIVPHFKSPRVGAVTGNPRVANRNSFLGKLQAIEFSSIISLQRRGQRIWGRIMTMSGVVGAFRRSALVEVGLFSPEMATEDIDLTWKLQLRHYDVRYEARAVVWMHVPRSLGGFWRQRRRWTLGLAQVLRRHGPTAIEWEHRRLWPVLCECVLSILWSYDFVVLTVVWVVSYSAGYPPIGASPIPNWWGMLIGTTCLAQLLTGVILDRPYDLGLGWYYAVAVFYPIIYWIITASVTAVYSIRGLLAGAKPGRVTRWNPVRE